MFGFHASRTEKTCIEMVMFCTLNSWQNKVITNCPLCHWLMLHPHRVLLPPLAHTVSLTLLEAMGFSHLWVVQMQDGNMNHHSGEHSCKHLSRKICNPSRREISKRGEPILLVLIVLFFFFCQTTAAPDVTEGSSGGTLNTSLPGWV